MPKFKIKSPAYSLVAADMSGAEVRTACSAAQDFKMMDAYRQFYYDKEFTSFIELQSFEELLTDNNNEYKSLYILEKNDIIIDKDGNKIQITGKEDLGDTYKLYLSDNNLHTFKVNKPGQDLYSLIASKAYNNKYEDNLEFYPKGTKIMFEGKEVVCGYKEYTNKAGKVRRQDSKSLLIGLIYGRGVSSICDQICESRLKKGGQPITKEETQALINNIYESFPRLKAWMDETHDFIHKNGYIDDAFGRRRRLPDAQLPRYNVTTKGDGEFNPLIGCGNRVDTDKINKYQRLLENVKWKRDYDKIKADALKEDVEIHDNQGYIAQAERQSVNFQAQGASSEINKLSMIAIDKNERLKELGAKLLLTIHDEVIVECPSENAEEVASIIPKIMVDAGKDYIKCPMVSESSIFRHWYEDDNISYLNDVFTGYIKGNPDKNIQPLSDLEAVKKISEEHTEFTYNQLYNFFINHCGYLWDNINY